MTETFLQLTAAYLLGEFTFQTEWIEKNKNRGRILLAHVAIVTTLAMLLLGSLHWQILVATFFTHWTIDFTKLKLRKESAAADCDSKTCEEAAIGIKKRGFTTEMPEFVGQINARAFAFVYAEGVSFDCPNFLDFCRHWSMMTGAFRVDALAAWLKEQP
jgi:hypothetical protein